MHVTLARATAEDRVACRDIAAASPEHLDPAALPRLEVDLVSAATEVHVARDGGDVLGFATLGFPGPKVAEIIWMAVLPDRRGQGVGTAMLRHLESMLAERGMALLAVKTLAASSPYTPYVATRRFYERAGFLQVDTIDPYPNWSPGNPCAIYVKPLQVQ